MKNKIRLIAAVIAMWLIILACFGGAGWFVGTIHLTMGWWAIGKLCAAFALGGLGWFCGEYMFTEMMPRKKAKRNEKPVF